jgi:hypothetical protein
VCVICVGKSVCCVTTPLVYARLHAFLQCMNKQRMQTALEEVCVIITGAL